MRNLTAAIQQAPATTMASHVSNPSPTMHGSVGVDSSNHTPPLSPRFNSGTPNGNTNLNISRYIEQQYQAIPQTQSMVELYQSSAAYSPISSPYSYSLPPNNLFEHEVKLEGMPAHSTTHGIHHGHHHHHHQMPQHMGSNQHHSRSPSVEDERRDMQSQIVSRNLERPSVVNIKME